MFTTQSEKTSVCFSPEFFFCLMSLHKANQGTTLSIFERGEGFYPLTIFFILLNVASFEIKYFDFIKSQLSFAGFFFSIIG